MRKVSPEFPGLASRLGIGVTLDPALVVTGEDTAEDDYWQSQYGIRFSGIIGDADFSFHYIRHIDRSFALIGTNDFTTLPAPVNLSAQANGGSGNGTFSWFGNGITDEMLGTFDPIIAGPGEHIITIQYNEGNCDYGTDFICCLIYILKFYGVVMIYFSFNHANSKCFMQLE